MTIRDTGPIAAPSASRQLIQKVPAVTAVFWIIKILTTGMGETTSDYLAHQMDPAVAVGITGVTLVCILILQFAVRRYLPWTYWLTVAMVSVFGTMAADVLHVALGIPYVVSTAFFLIVLGGILALWHASEKTLSIHSIFTRRREAFYWATVMATFALGTAAGDMTATTMHLGYFSSAILFAALMAIPALAYWRLRLNAILAFWLAYIVTRPFGASAADWLGLPAARGGVGLGTGAVSLGLAAVIAVLVGYLSLARSSDRRR